MYVVGRGSRRFVRGALGLALVACGLSSAAEAGASPLPRVTLPARADPHSPFAIGPADLVGFADPDCAYDIADADRLPWGAVSARTFSTERTGCQWLGVHVALPVTATATEAGDWVAEVGYQGLSELWVRRDDGAVTTYAMGNDRPLADRPYAHIWADGYLNIAPLDLEPGRGYDLVVRYRNPRGASLYGTNDPLAITMRSGRGLDRDSRIHLVASGLMIGGLLLLLLYQLAQWWVYRTELDASYCLMLVGLLAYVSYDDFLVHAFFSERVVPELWLYVTGSLGLVGFFRFAQLTLRSVAYHPGRDRTLGALVAIEAVKVPTFLALGLLAGRGYGWPLHVYAYVPEGFRLLLLASLLVFTVAVLAHFRVNRDPATRAFTLGNLALVVGVAVVVLRAYILPYAHVPLVGAYLAVIDPPFKYIIEIAIVAMALCFAFAVAIVTKDRESGLERNFNRRLAEVRMESLRSPMNPHFLFNGLNSIKLFVIDNEPRLAGDYLSRFARLIRLVLENSKASLITLARELETLDLYLRMESLRFGDKFAYTLEVDPSLEPDFVLVPPTLVQPYVENAIWHGLLHRDVPGGHLWIRIRDAERGRVRIEIEDNGIGRARASGRRHVAETRHKSMGMQITAERIALLRQLHGFDAVVEVEDLHDSAGEPTGTRVTIDLSPTPAAAVEPAGWRAAPSRVEPVPDVYSAQR